ncbi:MAG: hypothetical protein ACR2Q3_01565 [Woeseiaceae bacterium]
MIASDNDELLFTDGPFTYVCFCLVLDSYTLHLMGVRDGVNVCRLVVGNGSKLEYQNNGAGGSLVGSTGVYSGGNPTHNYFVQCGVTSSDASEANLYLDGYIDASGTRDITYPTSNSNRFMFGAITGGAHNLHSARISHAFVFDRELSPAEMADLDRNRYQLFSPVAPLLALVPSGAGSVTLTPTDLAHAHAIDGSSLTQHHQLSPAELAQVHAIDGSALTQHHQLSPAELAHAHLVDNTTLTVSGTIAPAELAHAHLVEVATVTGRYQLTAADITQAHLLDNTTVQEFTGLSPASLAHSHLVAALTLVQHHQITPAELAHAHLVDHIILSNPLAPTTGVITAALDIYRDVTGVQSIQRFLTDVGKLG